MFTTKIKINSLLYSECVAEWSWDTRKNVLIDYDLWYIAKGTGTLRTDSAVFNLSQGSCFILQPGKGYLATHNPDDPLTVYAVHFELCSSPDPELPFAIKLDDFVFFEKLCRRLVESDEQHREIWMYAILDVYVRTYESKTTRLTVNQERVVKIKHFIEENLDNLENKLCLDEISASIFLSRNQCSRVFKQVAGVTIQDYILKKRLEKAAALLLQSNLPIKSIARLCGYSDPTFFCRQFKKIQACTPQEFRKKQMSFIM
ncbi:MAG: helix-turn-helix domain-containing protein [Spirochaetia bacterium]|nr:helix-turn-helix domain-containing protein [Spirochaetia bacterium]